MYYVFFWLILLIALAVIELATMGLTTIWFAGGSLMALFVAVLEWPFYVQAAVFLAVSAILLVFTRPVALKLLNQKTVKTNAESLVGEQAIVLAQVNNLQSQGSVTVNGMEWMARSADESKMIPEGSVVTIVAISGAKLIVEEAVLQEAAKGEEVC